MDRRTRNLFALILVLVIAVTGGAALVLGDMAGPVDPEASDDGRDGSFIVGVVVAVDNEGLTDVRSFKLRLGDVVSDFVVGELENASQFPPAHLLEHQATAQPVRGWEGVRTRPR